MQGRKVGLDVIRSMALIFVLCIHAMEYTGVVEQAAGQWSGIFWVVLRYCLLSAVPLFLILSGYLQRHKTLSKKYYRSILPLLVAYGIIAVVCVVAKATQGVPMTVGKGLLQILNFSANSYSWYVEMYIGLFLLMPFLNQLFKALGDKKKQGILILTLAGVTLLPGTLSGIGGETYRLAILPDYWEMLYPVTYYFIGSYIATYPPKVSAKWVWGTLGSIALPSILCIGTSLVLGQYAWWVGAGYANVFVGCIAVGFFVLLYARAWNNRWVKGLAKEVATCAYEMYLMSYLTDQVVYRLGGGTQFGCVWISLLMAYILSKLLRLTVIQFIK